MYKLLIADDEQWIRQGLTNTIDWSKLGICEVFEAEDGEDALAKVRETLPDIVVADIRMPEIDGLMLSAILRKEYPGIKIIIISGYKDFDYAREAVELGVSNYILKPINENSIMETVRKCVSELDHDRKLQSEHETIKSRLKENILKYDLQEEARHILDSMVSGDKCGLEEHLEGIQSQIYACRNVLSDQEIITIYSGLAEYVCRGICQEVPPIADQTAEDLLKLTENMKASGTLEEMCLCLKSGIEEWCRRLESIKGSQKRKIIQEAIDYIHRHYSEKISLSTAAEYVHLNPSYLSKLFCEETGDNFTKYLMKVRVEKAKELLRDPRIKVYEVGDLVGYSDIKYFVKIFKEIGGTTPTYYRERCMQNKQKS